MSDYFRFLGDTTNKIFFSGMCGSSMLGLALMTKESGYFVLGSDSSPSDDAKRLCREHSIPLFFSHSAENVCGCSTLVYTAAIDERNEELLYAREHGIRTYTRAEYLGLITKAFAQTVAVAGTHGKSTVTHLIYSILFCGENTPYLLAGAPSKTEVCGYKSGSKDLLIYEACEYDRSFLNFYVDCAVILNIEKEHIDVYPSLESSVEAYYEFAKRASVCILNLDDRACVLLGEKLRNIGKRIYYFSANNRLAHAYCKARYKDRSSQSLDISVLGEDYNGVKLSLLGEHNVYNALCAILCAKLHGAEPQNIRNALGNFSGLKRRMEYIGTVNGARVYDDYAHHPTEIRATLTSARELGYKKIVCAFQPHTYSRTKEFFKEFTESFKNADEVIFADIYPAREENVFGISSLALANETENAIYIPSFQKITEYLLKKADSDTLILTMGAGKMNEIAYELCKTTKENF